MFHGEEMLPYIQGKSLHLSRQRVLCLHTG